ncbi:AsmA family protein [Breoghania sp. L-A4]|uniref:AsmA family protein n=1 Tax=Breoghania sp. L-A4 TaxID=2304600 RepID=UPI000E358776|nr:AsmA family protein [Breoghania sp. L-A4]AXS39360.1 AsmA family protein [Breoghania sp. L-A4]
MKRGLIASAVAILFVAALFAAVPLLVSTDIARDRIAAILSQWLGANVVVGGEPQLMLVPKLHVVLPDVRTENSALGLTATIDGIEADLDLVALLQGRIEPTRFTLRRPLVQISAQSVARTFAFPAAGDAAAGELRPAGAARMLTVHDGVLTLTRDDGPAQHFDGINAALSWPGSTGAASLSGAMRWRQQDIELRASLTDAASLVGDGAGSFNLTLASSALRASFAGTVSGGATVQADGALSVTAPNLRRVLAWAGQDLGDGATLGAFSIEGAARVGNGGLVLSPAALELDGNEAEGAIALTWNGDVPSVKGTLASETIDLTGYVSELMRATSDLGPDAIALSPRALSAADVDLQISAQRIHIGETRIGQTAVSLLVQDGNMAMEVGEAMVYGGHVTARLSAKAQSRSSGSGSSLAVHLETKAKGLVLGALPLADWPVRPTAGAADISLNAGGAGATLAELLATLGGDIRVTATDPVLTGMDLANVIETFAGGDPAKSNGSTVFTTAAAAGTIDSGVLSVTGLSAEGPTALVSASGRASLEDFSISMNGVASRPSTGDTPGTELPFLIRGPLSAPQFLPDLNKLIDTATPSLAN